MAGRTGLALDDPAVSFEQKNFVIAFAPAAAAITRNVDRLPDGRLGITDLCMEESAAREAECKDRKYRQGNPTERTARCYTLCIHRGCSRRVIGVSFGRGKIELQNRAVYLGL